MNEIKNTGQILAPGFLMFDDVINNCEHLINLALSKSEWKDAHIFDNKNSLVKNDEVRNNRILDVGPTYRMEEEWFTLAKTIFLYGDGYSQHYSAGFSGMEHPQLLHYSHKADNFYKVHSDSGFSVPRVFSAVLYLNDVEEGGETHFVEYDLSVKPKAGRLIFFPSNYVAAHEARPPVSNDKFAVVTWFNP